MMPSVWMITIQYRSLSPRTMIAREDPAPRPVRSIDVALRSHCAICRGDMARYQAMQDDSRPPDHVTTLATRSSRASSNARRACLLGIEADNSRLIPFPEAGTVTIGRSGDADVVVADGTTSRRHAEIVVTDSDVIIRDLDSRLGTYVNGTPLPTGHSRSLFSGDRISLGGAVFFFEQGAPAERQKPLLQSWELRWRAEEEIERASRHAGELAVFVLTMDDEAGHGLTARIADVLADCVVLYDVAGLLPDHQLCLLKPHLAATEVNGFARDMLQRLTSVTQQVRVGVASYPRDGGDFDTLLDGARAAVEAAPAGDWHRAGEVVHTEALGGDNYMIMADRAMRELFDLARRLARNPRLSVIIRGETGTGKEFIARAIHHHSGVAGRLVTVNCAGLGDSLAQSTLFGHERGAFTGALTTHRGVFEQAHKGTLFLDELGDLPPGLQAAVLRVLEGHPFTRLGGETERRVECRFVAATNRDLKAMVEEGTFREDLYQRLRGAELFLPPLRSRRRDIVPLAECFLASSSASMNRDQIPELSPDVLRALHTFEWSGNVRELERVMEYSVTAMHPAADEMVLEDLPEDVRAAVTPGQAAGQAQKTAPTPVYALASDDGDAVPGFPGLPADGMNLKEWQLAAEVHFMRLALERTRGNQTHAARLLDMKLRTFHGKVKKYKLA